MCVVLGEERGEECGVAENAASPGTWAQALSAGHDLCNFLQIIPLLCPSNSSLVPYRP